MHGHFELELGAHFKLELGGQYHWNLQKDTLHKSLDKLISEGEILSTKHGVYQTKMKENDGE